MIESAYELTWFGVLWRASIHSHIRSAFIMQLFERNRVSPHKHSIKWWFISGQWDQLIANNPLFITSKLAQNKNDVKQKLRTHTKFNLHFIDPEKKELE